MSRRQKLIEDEDPIELPPLDCCEYLLGYLYEIGPTMAAGMGEAPLSNLELFAWQANIGIQLAPWELRFLRGLSHEYLAQSQKSEDPACPAPFGGIVRAKNINQLIDAAFG